MSKLDEAPSKWIPIEQILKEFQISRATFWNYVRRGLIAKPRTFRVKDNEIAQKVRQGFVPPEAKDDLQLVKALKRNGMRMDEIQRLFSHEDFSISLRGFMFRFSAHRLRYLPDIFQFDTKERMENFFSVSKRRYGKEWGKRYKDYLTAHNSEWNWEVRDSIMRGDFELKSFGENASELMVIEIERTWFKENWDVFLEVIPEKVPKQLEEFHELASRIMNNKRKTFKK